jgi:transcriptional regulator with XRE-family HTH domain
MPPREKVQHVDDPVAVGRRLRAAREAVGLSQRQLSFPGCTAAYISRIENGERTPSLQLLREFAHRVGVTESFLAVGRNAVDTVAGRVVEARVALRVGDLDAARAAVDAAVAGARSDAERASAAAVAGEVSLAAGDSAGAVAALEQARTLDASLESADPAVADALGRAYARGFDVAAAAAVLTRALAQARESGDAIATVRFAGLLAQTAIQAGDGAAAERAVAEVADLADELADPLARVRHLWASSRAHALAGDDAAAQRDVERAFAVLEASDQRYHAALAQQLLAHARLDGGDHARAAELLQRAAPLLEDAGRPLETAAFRVEHARALLAAGRRDEAAALAEEAAAALADLGPTDGGRSHAAAAELLCELGEAERAGRLLESAIDGLCGTPTRFLVEAYRALGDLQERRGDHPAALETYKRAMQAQVETERTVVPPA